MKKKVSFDRFWSLLAQLPGADKEDLVWQFSGLLTTSLREFYALDPQGYHRMLEHLQKAADHKNEQALQEIKKLRSAVLKRLQRHGVDTTSWVVVNNFLCSPRIAGKRLYEMDASELRALIPKLESILHKDVEKREEHHRLSMLN